MKERSVTGARRGFALKEILARRENYEGMTKAEVAAAASTPGGVATIGIR
ncbi:MAG: hypothetical protein NTV22_00915 [bacterium]|nr:hypothetical protein [bacterium]